MSDLKNWQELPLGGVITEGGNAAQYQTGTWRTWRPVWRADACIHCLTCWVYCPEDAFRLKEGQMPNGKPRREISEIDYFHCKGCGLCVKECPVNKKGDRRALDFAREEM